MSKLITNNSHSIDHNIETTAVNNVIFNYFRSPHDYIDGGHNGINDE